MKAPQLAQAPSVSRKEEPFFWQIVGVAARWRLRFVTEDRQSPWERSSGRNIKGTLGQSPLPPLFSALTALSLISARPGSLEE